MSCLSWEGEAGILYQSSYLPLYLYLDFAVHGWLVHGLLALFADGKP